MKNLIIDSAGYGKKTGEVNVSAINHSENLLISDRTSNDKELRFRQIVNKQLNENATFHRVKSPLRYPGGKSRAVNLIRHFFPYRLMSLCSPFFGGGSIELALASKGVRVYSYDHLKPLVCFWQMLLKNAPDLAKRVRQYEQLTPEIFYHLQTKILNLTDKLEIAALFYVLNRAS